MSENIHGFYYDQQLSSKTFTVTLHPNTVIKNPGEILTSGSLPKWELATENDGNLLKPIQESNSNSGCYLARPIFRGIYSEDFQFDINNSWTNFDGGNAIEGIFNSIKPYAPYLTKADEVFTAATEKAEKAGIFGSVATTVNGWAKQAGDILGKTGAFLNNALRVQGSRYAYYQGTDVGFGNMLFKTILFSDYTNLWEPWDNIHLSQNCNLYRMTEFCDNQEYRYVSCLEKFMALLPYISGIYHPFQSKDINSSNSVINEVTEYLETEKLVGWQKPPAGFIMNNRDIDYCMQGTLRAIFNGLFTIENLKINQVSTVISKVTTQHPITHKRVPLYLELTLQVSPASGFTDQALRRFIGLTGTDNKLLDWETMKEGDVGSVSSSDQERINSDKNV